MFTPPEKWAPAGLKRDYLEAGDELEVRYVDGGDVKAQVQGSRSDDKVFEVDGDALGSLLALDLSGKLGDASETGCTIMSRVSSSTKVVRRTRSASDLAL
jgi:hypothetical protein